MAEPTNPGQPSDSTTERGTPVNVNEATVGTVNVRRMDVVTGEIKELQTDLLEKLCECIEAQTMTLGGVIESTKSEITKALHKEIFSDTPQQKKDSGEIKGSNEYLASIAKNIKALVAKSTGGGEGELGPGGSAVAARAAADEWDAISETLGKDAIQVKEWGKLFAAGVNVEFKKNIGNVNKAVLDFGQSLTNINASWRKAVTEAKSIMELGQGGLIDVTALYQDLGAGIAKNRDALQSSVKTLIEFRDQNQLLIGTLGSDLEEVSQAFRRNREAVDAAFGDDFLGKIPFEDQNAILMDILAVQRRAGVTGEATKILESRSTRTQLEYLQEISFQTGKTVKEIMKLYKEELKTFNVLEGLGLLQPGEAMTTTRNADKLRAAGQGSFVDVLTEIIQAGGVTRWMGDDEANAAFAQTGNNMALLNKALVGLKTGTNEGADAVVSAGSALQNLKVGGQEAAGGLLATLPGLQRLAGIKIDAAERALAEGGGFVGAAAARERQAETASGKIGLFIADTYNDVKEFLASNFGAGGDMAIALTANTIATWLNTRALGGKSVLGMAKGLLSKIPGVGKFFGGSLATATTSLGAAPPAAAGTAGKIGSRIAGAARVGGAALGGTAAVAGAGVAGYQLGKHVVAPLIDSAIANLTGVEDATLGTWLADTFKADSTTDEQKAKTAAEVAKLRARAAERAAAKKGIAVNKGVNPLTPGDQAVVAPSDVVSPTTPKALIEDPISKELIKQSAYLESLVELITQGNLTRTNMLDVIGQSGAPVSGKHSSPRTRRGAHSPVDAYTPLYEGGPS